MKPLRFAIIGVGSMGKNHARIVSKLAKLVAVSDSDPVNGNAVASQYGAKFYQNYEELLKKEQLDAVTIALPTTLHKQAALLCIAKKIPVLLEKPIADTPQNAKKIITAAKAAKTILMIGHIERYNPAIIQVNKLIKQGYFGQIVNLLAVRIGVCPPKVTNSDVVLDLAIHDIDLFNYFLDEVPQQVEVMKDKVLHTNNSDTGVVVMKYKHALGTVQTNWVSPTKVRKLYITGLRRSAELNYIDQTLQITERQKNVSDPKSYLDFVSKFEATTRSVGITKQEPLELEVLHFINLVRKNTYENADYAYQALVIVSGGEKKAWRQK
jgi:UDP-N-acetylglucosamine 3-dehydrogenase